MVALGGHTFVENYVLKQLCSDTYSDPQTIIDLLNFAMSHANTACAECQQQEGTPPQ